MKRYRWVVPMCLWVILLPGVAGAVTKVETLEAPATAPSVESAVPTSQADDSLTDLDLWFTISAGGSSSWYLDTYLDGTVGQGDIGIPAFSADLALVSGFWVPDDSEMVAVGSDPNAGGNVSGGGSAPPRFAVPDAAAALDAPITEFALMPVSPTPTQEVAHISWAVPRESRVRLTVHDVQGRQVAVLADGAYAAGRHSVNWNITRDRGALSPGIFFLRLQTPDNVQLRRLVLAP